MGVGVDVAEGVGVADVVHPAATTVASIAITTGDLLIVESFLAG